MREMLASSVLSRGHSHSARRTDVVRARAEMDRLVEFYDGAPVASVTKRLCSVVVTE